jgi:hypothetical protein
MSTGPTPVIVFLTIASGLFSVALGVFHIETHPAVPVLATSIGVAGCLTLLITLTGLATKWSDR